MDLNEQEDTLPPWNIPIGTSVSEAGKQEVWRGEITSATFVIQGHFGSFYNAAMQWSVEKAEGERKRVK